MDGSLQRRSDSCLGFTQEHHALLSFLVRLFDSALIISSLSLAATMDQQQWTHHHTLIGFMAIGLFSLFGNSLHVYESWRGAHYLQSIRPILVAWALTTGCLLLLSHLTEPNRQLSATTLNTWLVLVPVLVALTRILLRTGLNQIRSLGFNYRNIAILGMTDEGSAFANYIQATPSLGMRLTGFYDARTEASGRTNKPQAVNSSGYMPDLLRAARNGEIDHVYIAISLKGLSRIQGFVEELSDSTVDVSYIPDTFAQQLFHSRRVDIGPIPTLSINVSPHMGIDGGLKRLEDILLGAVILLLIAVPMLIITILIKTTSPGPVLFKQRRYGLGGKMINVWKFRTMSVCEDGDKIVQASRDDVRITALGAFLRRTSLDELPQFINVLRGEMSIVGPRPHAVAHNEQYRKIVSKYMLRHKVKPGITGWAQINGYRGETQTVQDMNSRVQHDLWYIDNWSLLLDLKIVLKTVFVGFSGNKAY
jgi:putative colanic acid biosynthesis UDP-glucose lipid carrier transferase